MGSYYGYVKRDADSYIDWAAIGTQLNENLEKVEKDREKKREAFDAATRESSTFLANNPMGEDRSVNEYSLQLANDAQNYLLQLQKLVKSGKMKMNDFILKKQNLIDDATSLYGIMKDYQDRAKQVAERTQKGLNQQLEIDVFKQLEGFSNFSNSYAYIDPNTGRIWNAKKEKRNVDGNEMYTIPNSPTGNLQLIRSLAKTMAVNYDNFDMVGSAKKMVDGFGKYIYSVEKIANTTGHTGLISEIMDQTQRGFQGLSAEDKDKITSFREAETKMIETQLANLFNVTSILTNNIRGGYSTTFDPDEAAKDANKILLKVVNGQYMPDFSTTNGKRQYNEALETMRNTMRMMYDRVEKVTTTPQLKDAELERKQAEAEIEYKKGMLGVAQSQAETGRVNAMNKAEELRQKKVAKASGKGAKMGDGREIDANKLADAIDNMLGAGDKGTPDWYVVDSPRKTSENLKKKLAPLGNQGFTITPKSTGLFNWDDAIHIKPPGSKSQEFVAEINDDFNWKDIIDYFKDPSMYDPEYISDDLIKAKGAELD